MKYKIPNTKNYSKKYNKTKSCISNPDKTKATTSSKTGNFSTRNIFAKFLRKLWFNFGKY